MEDNDALLYLREDEELKQEVINRNGTSEQISRKASTKEQVEWIRYRHKNSIR